MKRIIAIYRIQAACSLTKAAAILAGEQSTGTFVKLTEETDSLKKYSGAIVEHIEPIGSDSEPLLPCKKTATKYEHGIVTISWPLGNIGTSLPNLLSTVAGNLFELEDLSAIRLENIHLPKDFRKTNPGPQFGISGTRKLIISQKDPLIGTIIKPSVGLNPEQTSQIVEKLLNAGIDFIKDDELQANGHLCQFSERVKAVMSVVNKHQDKTGKRVLYAFNITDELDKMCRNLDLLESYGAGCAMVCLISIGLTGLRAVRNRSSLVIHGHRAGWGVFSRSPNIGISFQVWQKLWRLAGADHLHVNGLANKFSDTDETVIQAAQSVQTPIFDHSPFSDTAVPVFSSGQTVWQVGKTRALLKNDDFILCAGGGIIGHPDGVKSGVIAMKQAYKAAQQGYSPLEYASLGHSELRVALQHFKQPKFSI